MQAEKSQKLWREYTIKEKKYKNTESFRKFVKDSGEGTRRNIYKTIGVEDASRMTCKMKSGSGMSSPQYEMGGHVAIRTEWHGLPMTIELRDLDDKGVAVVATLFSINTGWGDGSLELPGVTTNEVQAPFDKGSGPEVVTTNNEG